jgi:hypothetical protein
MRNKRALLCAVSAALLASCGSSDLGVQTTPSVQVTAPAPSSSYAAGCTCTVRWTWSGALDSTVAIDLYDYSGVALTVAASAPNSGSFAWRIPTSVAGGTNYCIEVSGTGPYFVQGFGGGFTIVNNSDPYEPDNRSGLATPIDTFGTPQLHRIGGNDTDWFKFDAVAGRTYCIETRGSGGVYLQLFSTDALTMVASSNYGGVGYNGQIIWTCPVSGTYYFRVTAANYYSSTSDYTVEVHAAGAMLVITSPASGTKVYSSGEEMNIAWAHSANSGSYVSLYAYRDDTLACTIATGVGYYGSYNWTIPWSLPGSSNYRIKIVSSDDTSIHDFSDQFTVVHMPTTLSVTVPSGSVNWSTGGTYSIDWSYSGNPGSYVNLDLYDSGSLVSTIASSIYVSNDYYSWTLPNRLVSSGSYRIKITSASDTSVFGYSSAFTITHVPTSLKVTTPSSAASWSTGSSYSIAWNYTGNLGSYVNLALYDSVSLVATISTGIYLTNQYYTWAVPWTLATGKYRIRIASTADTTVSGVSAPFTIIHVPTTVAITAPSALSSWNTGSSYLVGWTYTGNPSSYMTLTLYDSAMQATTISSGTYLANQYYAWDVPWTLAIGKYRIRIVCTGDTTVSAFSPPFTVTHTPTTLTITTPSAATSWNSGTAYSVYWVYTGNLSGMVSISLIDSLSQATSVIQSTYLSNEYYSWSIPLALATGKYRLKITSTSDTTVSGLSAPFTITHTPNTLTITTPSAYTAWNSGTVNTVYWTSTGSQGSYVSLALFDSARLVSTITASTLWLSGSYPWTIPASTATGKYRIKIVNSSDTTEYGYSAAFTITHVPSTLTITTPNTATLWNSGSTNSILWTYTGSPGPFVNLTLYDSVSLPLAISLGVYLTSQSYAWAIPSGLGTGNYRIRIASAADTSVYNMSSSFRIINIPSTFSITSPAKGTTWTGGAAWPIYWSSSGNVGTYARIDLYDDTAYSQTIAASTSVIGQSFLWFIPTALVGDAKYRIRISSISNPAAYGLSDYFTVVQAPTQFAIENPASEMSWKSGLSYQVSWSVTGLPVSDIKLELYDSTDFVGTVVSRTAVSMGYYLWTIPSTLTSGPQYRIRIADADRDAVFAYSGYFTISAVPSIIVVTEPSSSSMWKAGSLQSIAWTDNGNVPSSFVSIWLFDSLQTGALQSNSYIATAGGCPWTVPAGETPGRYRIQVVSTADPTIYGYSDYFYIVAP